MKRRRKIHIFLGVFLVVIMWRGYPMMGIFTGSNMNVSRDFKLLEGIAPPGSGSVVFYDGFSHPTWDTPSLCFEILLKPRRILHGHAFAHSATESNAARRIGQILTERSTFQEWLGNKACGGFHADRYFRWTKNSEEWEVLLCMGCHEALLFHNGQSLRCDISREAAKEIEAIEKEDD